MAGPGEDAVRELADYFADLRDKAGRPSFTTLAAELPFSKSTIHEAFRGYQPPSQDLAERLIDHLGGDVRDGMRRWRAARARRPAGVYETAWLTDLEDPSRYLAWMNFDPMQWFDRILAPDPGPDAAAVSGAALRRPSRSRGRRCPGRCRRRRGSSTTTTPTPGRPPLC